MIDVTAREAWGRGVGGYCDFGTLLPMFETSPTKGPGSGRYRAATALAFLVSIVTILNGFSQAFSDSLGESANGWVHIAFGVVAFVLGTMAWRGDAIGLQAMLVLYIADTVILAYLEKQAVPALVLRFFIIVLFTVGLFRRKPPLLPVPNVAPPPTLRDFEQWWSGQAQSESQFESMRKVPTDIESSHLEEAESIPNPSSTIPDTPFVGPEFTPRKGAIDEGTIGSIRAIYLLVLAAAVYIVCLIGLTWLRIIFTGAGEWKPLLLIPESTGNVDTLSALTVLAALVLTSCAAVYLLESWVMNPWRKGAAGLGFDAPSTAFLIGAAISGSLLSMISPLLLKLTSDPTVTNLHPHASTTGGPYLVLAVAFVGPFLEELLFRGALLAGFSHDLGPKIGGGLVTLGFVALHPAVYHGARPLIMISLLSIGALLWRLRSDSIYPPMTMHMAYNFTLLVVLEAP